MPLSGVLAAMLCGVTDPKRELNRRVIRVLCKERDAVLRAALEELHLGLVEAALDLRGLVRLIGRRAGGR